MGTHEHILFVSANEMHACKYGSTAKFVCNRATTIYNNDEPQGNLWQDRLLLLWMEGDGKEKNPKLDVIVCENVFSLPGQMVLSWMIFANAFSSSFIAGFNQCMRARYKS